MRVFVIQCNTIYEKTLPYVMSCLSSIKGLHICPLLFYWVLTSPSFSTLMWSSDERVWTLSSGNSALLDRTLVVPSVDDRSFWPRDVREALDQLELGGDPVSYTHLTLPTNREV